MPLLVSFFIAAAILWTALSLTLSTRQIAHVRRFRAAVPDDFAREVSADEHAKAAD